MPLRPSNREPESQPGPAETQRRLSDATQDGTEGNAVVGRVASDGVVLGEGDGSTFVGDATAVHARHVPRDDGTRQIQCSLIGDAAACGGVVVPHRAVEVVQRPLVRDAAAERGGVADHDGSVEVDRPECAVGDPAAPARRRVAKHVADVDGQDAAAGNTDIPIADAPAVAQVAGGVAWGRVPIHVRGGHGHRAVVEDPTTYAAGSDVGVHVAVGDSGQATVGNAAGSRAADTAGRDVVVHVAIGDDERAAGAWRSAVPVAAGNAAPVGRGVAVDLAADDAESARAVQNPPSSTGGGRVVVHLAVVFNRGRTGSTNGDRAGISAGDPAAAHGSRVALHHRVVERQSGLIVEDPTTSRAASTGDRDPVERQIPVRHIDLEDAEGGRVPGERGAAVAIDRDRAGDERKRVCSSHRGVVGTAEVVGARTEVDGPTPTAVGVGDGDDESCRTTRRTRARHTHWRSSGCHRGWKSQRCKKHRADPQGHLRDR